MAVTTKIIRVANPRKSRGRFRLRTARRKNARAKKRMTAKQIRFFGTARQKAALKSSRKRKANRTRKTRTNPSSRRPKVKVIYRTRPAKKVRRRRTNPGLVVTLGSVNPRKRRRSNPVAKTHKRSRRRATNARRHHVRRTRRKSTNVRRRRTRRTRNPRKVYVMNPPRRRRHSRRRRTTMNRRHRRMNSRHRRNPNMFGRTAPKDLVTLVGGGLAGVWATKVATGYITPMISGATGSLGSFAPVLVNGISAFLLGWGAGKFISKDLGDAVLFGGLMQTGSVLINVISPSIGGQISLGDLLNGSYAVPQNPITAGNPMAMSAPAARGMSAYGPAY